MPWKCRQSWGTPSPIVSEPSESLNQWELQVVGLDGSGNVFYGGGQMNIIEEEFIPARFFINPADDYMIA